LLLRSSFSVLLFLYQPVPYEALEAFSTQRYDVAEKLLRETIAKRPTFDARFLLGATLVALGRNSEAVQHLAAAHKQNTAHLDCAKLLAAEYLGLDRAGEALKVVTPLLARRTADEELLLLAIEARHVRNDAGDAEEALRLSERGLARNPKSARLLAWRGFALRDAGALPEARKSLEAALKLEPDDIASRAMLADVFRLQGSNDKALKLFDQALAQAPTDEEALVGKARTLASMGKVDGAIDTMKAAVQASPETARLRLQLSQLYAKRGDTESAAREAAEFRRLRGSSRDSSIPSGLHRARGAEARP
jgi:tetratricopeptide (TPR) repeat protein